MYIDCHADTLSKLYLVEEPEHKTLLAEHPHHHMDFQRIQQGQLKLQIFSIFTMPYEAGHYGAVRSMQMMQTYKQDVQNRPETFGLVLKASDLDQVGRMPFCGLFSMEGASPLCGSMDLLEIFFELGLRAIGLTWNHRNELADGVGVGSDYGLTSFGREVIQRMNQLGMVVDLAHINETGFWEAMELSKAPTIVSHANAKALCGHRRNLTDAQLQAVKDKNGFVGICFYPSFLSDSGVASLEDVIRHIDYICEKIGPEHIALGSDFDGIGTVPKGLEDVSCFPRIGERLHALGYTQDDIQKITHENVLRVYRHVLPKG